MAVVRARIPETARRGEVISIRALIQHPMETGFRRDEEGKEIPRRIIHEFICRYNGDVAFRAEFFPAISADPFIVFSVRADSSGEIALSWKDDSGEITTEARQIVVT